NCRGIKYIDKEGNYVDMGAFSRIEKVDEIPWPAWDLVSLQPYWASQKSHGPSTYRDMPIMASRGCPYQCTFCSSPQMWTTRYILRGVDDVLNEIQHYIDKYGITSLQFYDLTAITKKSWTVDFCTKMMERGIRIQWSLPSGTRSEVLDEEVLPLLAKTRCTYLVYAPESGSPETLKRIKKRINLDRFTRSIKIAVANGLILRINLIIGFPFETRRHIYQTILYGWKLVLMGAEEAVVNLFSPYPGSELFRELDSEKKITLNDDYFYSLTSLNGDYTNFSPVTFCKNIGSRELAFYRIFSLASNYFLGYLFFPRRIFRMLKGLIKPGVSATIFERRMQDLFKRKRADAGNFLR
ncbi:MAG: B12-binding domain-containing radical SAM protein, partial [Deltaproteobacteria bacterium]|nr:B12-binding domain-containing radical SAM protein [Deltaproteobacteria bacterium]